MKFLLTALLIAPTVVSAFTILPTTSTTTLPLTTRFLENRINEKIDLESPEVATMETQVFCRCGKAKTFPLCDGSHVKYNEATGDNVGPLIVTVKAGE
ncbi:Iron-binding zinc finger CDGSH type [Fragilaria crotonensis]|nr:Iron-binding zinc finger CDGSH type [Fragilaria crotonensis]